MAQHPFHRLAPFIQEFIYRKGWKELRAVQAEAANVLFDTDDHLLIMSGTASGKTEAAFLPILTDLSEHPTTGLGVLYIGPLKALINDQFERLQELLTESHIQVQSWHGDIDQASKQKFLKHPNGVLQITPESLEAMLILRHDDLMRLFGDLRYIVIDEVHAFMHADRGQQILCQLQRIQASIENRVQPAERVTPRRIGLSATLGDPEGARTWLAGNTGRAVQIVDDKTGKRTVELALWHYMARPKDYEEKLAEAKKSGDPEAIAAIRATGTDYQDMLRRMYEQTQAKKSIIFTNSRSDAERVITGVRDVALRNKGADIYHVHHGNISAPLRAAAEAAMQRDDQPACTSATVTLELGIDIGQLDQVLQLNATYSVSSFVQRLGRSGRRGNPARMSFYHEEESIDEETHPGDHFPWQLIQTIAIIQLYVEERWIEPARPATLPFSLLFHQTLSTLAMYSELTASELATRVLSLPPFAHVTHEQYRVMLKHMLSERLLEQAETGTLIVGLNAERMVNNYRFYAVFPDEEAFSVRDESREIGTIQTLPEIGSVFRLAGYSWRAKQIDPARKTIFVERARSKVVSTWTGHGGDLHDRILERMKQVLTESTSYSYLQPRAVERLGEARTFAARYRISADSVSAGVPIGGERLLFFPWKGTRVFNTLALMLNYQGIKPTHLNPPYFMELDGISTSTALIQVLRSLDATPPSLTTLAGMIPAAALMENKFDPYLPEALRREAYAADTLAYPETLALLKQITAQNTSPTSPSPTTGRENTP